VTWKIVLTPTSQIMLKAIKDRRAQERIRDRIDSLASNPDKKGKSLSGQLTGYRSIRAGRYRIIYRAEKEQALVFVVALGIRKGGEKRDIYELAKKLIKAGLLEI